MLNLFLVPWRAMSLFSHLGQAEDFSDLEDIKEKNISVAVRIRPLTTFEIRRGEKAVVYCPGESTLYVSHAGQEKVFRFDAVFDSATSQEELFEESGMKRLIELALSGYSCTVFAFGQTGSGKTYSLTGPLPMFEGHLLNQSLAGLMQRSFQYLLEQVGARAADFTLSASYMEIYNEQVRDLLDPRLCDSLPVRWSKTRGFYVENLLAVEFESLDTIMALLQEGMRNRQNSPHILNESSSRSHALLTICIRNEVPNSQNNSCFLTKHGKLCFVDLAGSEKVKHTGSTGDLMVEANSINRSLLALGHCISLLVESKKKPSHIPYRDSNLTRLLADSLGGSGITLMIHTRGKNSTSTRLSATRTAANAPTTLPATNNAATLSETLFSKRDTVTSPAGCQLPGVLAFIASTTLSLTMDKSTASTTLLKGQVACVSPSSRCLPETMYTLRYANRVKRIKNRPTAHMEPKEKLLHNLEQEIQSLRAENVFLREQLPLVAVRRSSSTDPKEHASNRKLLQRESESREGGFEELPRRAPFAPEHRLYGILQDFLSENEKLRRENLVLMSSHNSAKHATRALYQENNQLLRKLEELERVLSSSPTVSSRSLSGHSQSLRISSPVSSGHCMPLVTDLPALEMFTGDTNGHPQHNDHHPTEGPRTHRSAPHRSQEHSGKKKGLGKSCSCTDQSQLLTDAKARHLDPAVPACSQERVIPSAPPLPDIDNCVSGGGAYTGLKGQGRVARQEEQQDPLKDQMQHYNRVRRTRTAPLQHTSQNYGSSTKTQGRDRQKPKA